MTSNNIERLSEHLEDARHPAADGVLPLFPELPPASDYPIARLGPVLGPAALAISRKVQVSHAMAAQSVLAVASLATQAHVDVQMPYGQTRPASLFCVTIAESGERKSTSDNEAERGVTRREEELRREYSSAFKTFKVEHGAWAAEKRKIENERDSSLSQRQEALRNLGAEPPPPLQPMLTTGDLTAEGLVKNWPNMHPSLGIFTAEGATFTGGHGMTADNKKRTAATFSEAWDGKPLKRLRAGDGLSILPGRRLALHMMVQPGVAADFLSDEVLRDQGLHSRILVAASPALAGTRLYRDPALGDEAIIQNFAGEINRLLGKAAATADDRNELTPRALRLSRAATDAWKTYYNHVEAQCGGRLKPIVDFANKAAEHVARIAAVMTAIADIDAAEIDIDTLYGAGEIVEFYITEKLRFAQAGRTDPELLVAHELLQWIGSQGGEIETSFAITHGPSAIRRKASLDRAVEILVAHGQVHVSCKRPRKVTLGPVP